MSSELAELYGALLCSTDNDHIQAITQALLSHYENPSTILSLFDVISAHPNPVVRQAATIGLKACFVLHWDERLSIPERDQIKSTILILLPAQPLLVAKNLVDFSAIVLKSETAQWPELMTTVQGLTDTHDHIVLASHILGAIVRFLEPEFIVANVQLFVQFAQLSIQPGSPEGLDSGYAMLGAMTSFVPPEHMEPLRPVLEWMLDLFPSALATDDRRISGSIAVSLGDSFQATELPIEPNEILGRLLALLQDSGTDPRWYGRIFTPINELVAWHGEELVAADPENTMRLISAIISCAVKVDNGGLYNDNEEMTDIASAAAIAAKNLKDPNYFNVVKAIPAPEDPTALLAYLLVVFNSQEGCQEDLLENMSWMADLIIGHLRSPLLPVREVALFIASDVSSLLSEDQVDLATAIVRELLPHLDGGELTFTAINSLIAILSDVSISATVIPTVLDCLTPLIRTSEFSALHPLAVEALASLVFAAEEDIVPYAQDLASPILAAASGSEEANPFLKQQGVMALSKLLRFAPVALESVYAQAVELIFQAGRTQDTDLRNSVMIAIGDLIIAKQPLLLAYKSTLCELIDSYFTADLFSKDVAAVDEDGLAANTSSLVGFSNIMRLIKWIFKAYPDLLPGDFGPWLEIPRAFMPVEFIDLQVAAISAALYGALFTRETNDFCDQLVLMIDNCEDGIVIGRCFKAVAVLIERETPIAPEYVQQFIAAGWKAIDGKLKCQQLDGLDLKGSAQVYRFLRLLFERDQGFPLDKLIQHGRKLLDRDERLFEVSQYTALLQHCYEAAPALPSLMKKALVTNVGKAFQKFIAVFQGEDANPFCVSPAPLAAVRAVISREPALGQQFLPQVVPFLQDVLRAEHRGEAHYWATVTQVLAFLAYMMRTDPDGFAYEQWIPLMAGKLYIRSEEVYAEEIWAAVVPAIASRGCFGAESAVLASCAQTLGLKDRKLEALALHPETFQNLIHLTSQLISAAGDGVNVQAFFQDEQSYERFAARLGVALR
jgi:hypothetical protein